MFRIGIFKALQPVKHGLRRASYSSLWNEQRNATLRTIYAPFSKLTKDSPQYNALAESGRVWEDYFQPGDSERYGYSKLQKLHTPLLKEIDNQRVSLWTPRSRMSHSLIAEYAHQSVFIENNRLLLKHSCLVDKRLKNAVPDLALPASNLSKMALPDAHSLLPNEDASQVAELRNHIVASRWVTDAALRNTKSGLSEDEIQCLSALLLRDTSGEKVYNSGWGGRVALGDYRQAPIQVKSNPLTIFPYHLEVPACMRRFIQWRDRVTREKRLHPLIVACHATVYFLHIHPFFDGNGRMSRLLMQDYMVRHGYAPVVMRDLDREEYLRMIKSAQEGNPEELVYTVLATQLEQLKRFGLSKWASSESEYVCLFKDIGYQSIKLC
ncbi:fido domain-containing protein [Trichoderma velutinum]